MVLKWQRKDAGLPNNEGDSLRGRRKGAKRIGRARGRCENGGPESGRIEPGRAKGVRGSLAKELSLSRKSGPRIRLEYLP